MKASCKRNISTKVMLLTLFFLILLHLNPPLVFSQALFLVRDYFPTIHTLKNQKKAPFINHLNPTLNLVSQNNSIDIQALKHHLNLPIYSVLIRADWQVLDNIFLQPEVLRFGNEEYTEFTFGTAFSRSFGKNVFVGIKPNVFLRQHIETQSLTIFYADIFASVLWNSFLFDVRLENASLSLNNTLKSSLGMQYLHQNSVMKLTLRTLDGKNMSSDFSLAATVSPPISVYASYAFREQIVSLSGVLRIKNINMALTTFFGRESLVSNTFAFRYLYD